MPTVSNLTTSLTTSLIETRKAIMVEQLEINGILDNYRTSFLGYYMEGSFPVQTMLMNIFKDKVTPESLFRLLDCFEPPDHLWRDGYEQAFNRYLEVYDILAMFVMKLMRLTKIMKIGMNR